MLASSSELIPVFSLITAESNGLVKSELSVTNFCGVLFIKFFAVSKDAFVAFSSI